MNPSVCSLRLVVALAAGMGLRLAAETLTLADGRTFQNAVVLSQSPRTVIVRHAGGLASIEKTKLPAALRERYPVDEAAALLEDARLAEERERVRVAAEAAVRAPAPEPAVTAAAKPAVSTATPRPPTREEQQAARKAAVLEKAAVLAQRHFESRYAETLGGWAEATVKLTDAREVDGWHDRWVVSGQAVVRYFRHLDPQRERELTEDSEANRKLTAKELKRIRARESYVRSEVTLFEAYVENPETATSIEVVLR